MMNEKFDALSQLLGCYFHQDWPEEFDSDISALQAIIDSEPREQVFAGLAEINVLLASPLSDNELRSVLMNQAGCYFEPDSLGITYREWLQRVRDKFAKQ